MHTEQLSGADRRIEPRHTAAGEVHLQQLNVRGAPFIGLLVDTAAAGFRARHHRFTLASGDLVDFEFDGHSGRARAMWTRIVDGQVETGFRICYE
jgi:hypothetical protein